MTIVFIVVLVAIIILLIVSGISASVMVTGSELEKLKALNSDQWKCDPIVWSEGPHVEKHVFKGTANLRCDVQGIHGGGIKELASHLGSHVLIQATTVHTKEVKDVSGINTMVYDVTIPIEDRESKSWVRGETYLQSTPTSLRHVFTPKEFEGKASKYVREMRTVLTVNQRVDRPSWYSLSLETELTVKKPWIVPAKKFENALVDKMETEMTSKSVDVCTSAANHL